MGWPYRIRIINRHPDGAYEVHNSYYTGKVDAVSCKARDNGAKSAASRRAKYHAPIGVKFDGKWELKSWGWVKWYKTFCLELIVYQSRYKSEVPSSAYLRGEERLNYSYGDVLLPSKRQYENTIK